MQLSVLALGLATTANAQVPRAPVTLTVDKTGGYTVAHGGQECALR